WGAQPRGKQPDVLSMPLSFVLAILDLLSKEYNIDPDRVYLAGQSDGGYGVWDLVASRPDRFAAAIALCGGGNPAKASRLVGLPIWAFHGSVDRTVPPSESRNMIQAIKQAGGSPRYTEYKGAGH